MKKEPSKIKRPSIFLFLTEMFRALLDLRKVGPFIKNYMPKIKGDGHPVLVIPGFMASDLSTKPLRRFLNKIGYQTCGWELGTNLADLKELDIVSAKVDQLYEKNGQAISLIGWSLGGVYARLLAKEKPDKIRQVITLASPFNGILAPNNAKFTFEIVKWLKGYTEPTEAFFNELPYPAPVPTTAFYSKKDGIVPWQVCMENVEDDIHQNIEVSSSHLGMGVHIEVLEIIADRLQYQERNWVKYGEANLFIGSY